MNWLTFTILAYLACALQIVLKPVWMIGDSEPMLALILLVFIALQAPAIHVAWAAIVLGLLADSLPFQHEDGLIGPWALGFLVAGYAMVQLRNLLFRDSMFTIAIMTLVAGVFALLFATALQLLRGVPALNNEMVEGFSAANRLYYGFGTLLYTAAVAIPVGFLLLRSKPIWGFSHRGMR